MKTRDNVKLVLHNNGLIGPAKLGIITKEEYLEHKKILE